MKEQSIAWFKLYDSILKQEKEKVFIIFRLLSHSIEKESLKKQLLGDIYQVTHDFELAKEFYEEAFKIAKNEKNLIAINILDEKLSMLKNNYL